LAVLDHKEVTGVRNMKYMNFQGPNFSMQVPTDWLITATPQFQAIFTAPIDDTDTIHGNVVVSIRAVKDDVTAVGVAKAAKNTQEKEYPQYQVLEETINETEPPSVERSYKWYKTDRQVDIVQRQAFHVYEGKLYTLTGTYPVSTDQKPQTLAHIIQKMIRSFKLEKD
jgi:hypothetical protein